jgi:putative DNA primase/helicase
MCTNYRRSGLSSQRCLKPHHLELLRASGIADDVIWERGYRSTDGGAELLELGFSRDQARLNGLLIPIYSPLGGDPLWQLRPDEPRREVKGDKVKIRKYELAPFSENRLDAHPRVQPHLKDVSVPLWITEGVKKADSLISAGECAIALIGVWNFKGKSRDPLANGSSVLLADFDAIAFKGRTVYIAFDSDVMGKAPVQQALARLTAILRQRGAHVWHVYLPDKPNGAKQGVDDFLAAGGTIAQLKGLARRPEEGPPHTPRPEEASTSLSTEAEITLDREFTDRNNALILLQSLKGKAIWVPQWGWLLWDCKRWARDHGGSRILALARELLPRHYLDLAVEELTPTERVQLCDYARRAHSLRHLSAALELAKGDLIADPKDFDQDPWLLNCSNGVLDLRTGELRPHSPELRLTKFCPVAYDPNAQAPTWERFLREIFLDDDELIRYVQRACGYSITGDVREDKLFICWGTGANGKSTFLQTLRRVLGDYAGAIAPAAIVHKGKDSHPTAVADLYGLRFAIAVETEEDQRLAEAQVKALTGRDSIKARFMHRDYFEFEPRAKIWLATNHRPLIRDTSPAIWRRIALIPFKAFFPPERQDKTLGDRLWEEREGILAWLVQGCLAWQQQGLGECGAVAEATENYKSEMDALQDWLQERCVPDPKAITPFKELYDNYLAWCSETDQEPLGKRAFANRLTEKGFEIARLKGDAKARKGLRLKTPADRTDRSDHNSGISPISAANGRNIETSVGSVGSVGSSPPDDDAEIPF